MKTGQRVVKNFLSLSVAEIFVRITGILLTIFIARYLGANEFGQLSFAMAFTGYFTVLSDFGLTSIGIREIAKDTSRTAEIANNILFLQLGISILLLVILTSILIFLPFSFTLKALIFLFGAAMIPGALGQTYIFQAYERMELVAIPRIIFQLVTVVFLFILLYLTHNVVVLPLVQLITAFMGAMFMYWLLTRYFHYFWGIAKKVEFRYLLIQSLPLAITAVAVSVYTSADSVILQFMKDSETVGIYSAGYKLILIILTLSTFMINALFPVLSSSWQYNRELFNRTVSEWARLAGIVAVPVTIGGLVLSNGILNLVYGNAYLSGEVPFSILLILPVIFILHGIYGNTLIAIGRQNESTKAYVVGAVLNIILNVVLIPLYGIVGAAIASVIAELTVLIILRIYFASIVRLSIERLYLVKPLIASVLMGGAVYFTRSFLPIALEFIIGGFIYLLLILVMRAVTKDDLKYLLDRAGVGNA